MERLTVNKNVSEMNMVELAHNSCYAKDGKAMYRDYGMEIDARELARDLIKHYKATCDGEKIYYDNNAFDDFMSRHLIDGPDFTIGLIALFYRNIWAQADLQERLKYYEDLEEQGLLLKLLCRVGDTVYEVQELRKRIQPYTIISIHISECSILFRWELKDGKGIYSNVQGFCDYAIGKTVFLTRAEAEEALERMRGQEVANDQKN